jgi:hypothetical protein
MLPWSLMRKSADGGTALRVGEVPEKLLGFFTDRLLFESQPAFSASLDETLKP